MSAKPARTVRFLIGAFCSLAFACNDYAPIVPQEGLPPVAQGMAMAFMPSIDRVVLFGGTFRLDYAGDELFGRLTEEEVSAETWTWHHDEGWSRLDIPGPTGRIHAAMAYDPIRDVLVLLGGVAPPGPDCPDVGVCQDLWTFDGEAWSRGPRRPEHARFRHLMAWSPPDEAFLVSGGWRDDGREAPLGAAFLFPDRWQPGPEAPSLWGLEGASMVWDAKRQAMLLMDGRILQRGRAAFGGGGPAFNRGVFAWVDPQWELLHLTNGSERSHSSMFYDPSLERVMNFAGLDDSYAGSGEFVSLEATGFEPLGVDAPPARWDAAVAYDSVHERAVLFGGHGDSPYGPLQDTWVWQGTTWSER